jgi:chromosome segregation ATPase
MSLQLKFKHWLVIIAPVALAVSALAWAGGKQNIPAPNQNVQDTVPAKNKHKNYYKIGKDEKDLDKAMKELDKAEEKLEGKVENIDWGKIDMEIEKSMKKIDEEMARHDIDMEKMEQDIEKSVKDIDAEKIEKETKEAVQHAMENVDFKKINEEVRVALAQAKEQLNSPEFRKNIEDVTRINTDEIKRELEKARTEIENSKVDIKEEMSNAKKEIKKAKEELAGYHQMLDEMEKEGLINTNADYSIEYKAGDLYINDQKQTQDVTNRYKNYFKKDNTRIYKKNGEFNISSD